MMLPFIPHEQAEAAKEEDGDNEDPAELEQHVELAENEFSTT